jgi:hypothetical protein
MSGSHDGGPESPPNPPENGPGSGAESPPNPPENGPESPPDSLGSGSPPSSDLEASVLGFLRALAALGLVAMLLGRVLGPALAGVFMGADGLVQGVGAAGELVSQAFALLAMLAAISAVLAVARSRLPLVVRFSAISLGGVGILTTLWALHEPVPTPSAGLVSGCAAVVALLAAGSAFRAPFARGPAVVVGLVAVGALVRLVAVALALQADGAGGSHLGALAGSFATVAFVADALAAVTAVAWVAGAAGRGAAGAPRLVNAWTILPLGLAMMGARWALMGETAESSPVALLVWRSSVRLLTLPEPGVSTGIRVFFAFLAPLTAVVALLVRGPVPALGAAVALALAARGSVEMPPCALMLVVGSLGLGLAAHEGRGLWAALPPRAGGPSAPERK